MQDALAGAHDLVGCGAQRGCVLELEQARQEIARLELSKTMPAACSKASRLIRSAVSSR